MPAQTREHRARRLANLATGSGGLYPSPSGDRCCLSKGSLPGRYSARNARDLASVSDGTSRRPLSRRPDDSGRHVRERRPPNARVEILTSASCLSTHAAGAGIDQGAEFGGPRAGHRRPWPRGSLVSVELERQIGQTNRTIVMLALTSANASRAISARPRL
jgi:hypothetical protein